MYYIPVVEFGGMQHTLYSATFLLGGGRAAERSVEGESLQRIITKNMLWIGS